jgi:membrane associated rhomboid family serine protease
VIPLRDDVPSRTYPFVNVALIALNVAAFVLELGLGPDLPRFFAQSAVVPVLYTGTDRSLGLAEAFLAALSPALGVRVLISMFLHGGLMHLGGNMLYLWIFGDNVEDRLGHLRYLVFYLLCGWIAACGHIWAEPASRVPAIGASGAIAGVLGGYLLLYPSARVVAVVPLGIMFPLVQIPALFFLGWWFVQQFLLGAMTLGERTGAAGGTAWWAHIGGFVGGLALVLLFQKPRRRPAERDAWWDDPRNRYYGRRTTWR